MDWSTSYRLFSQKRVDTAKLFEVVVQPGEEIPWVRNFKPIWSGGNVLCKSHWHFLKRKAVAGPEPFPSIFIGASALNSFAMGWTIKVPGKGSWW